MTSQAVRNSVLLSVAAFASRLLGWVRLIVLLGAFGADGRLDPYLAAFKVPDIIYQLIAAGPLSSVLVPLVVRLRTEGDPARAHRLISAVFLLFGLLGLAVALVAILLASGLAQVLAPGIGLAGQDEVAQLSRILAPSSVGLGIVAVASVWSATSERFFASSIGPLVYNLSVILFTLLGASAFGTTAPAVGTVVGASLFAAIALFDARAGGLRLVRPSFRDPLLFGALRSLAPRIGGLLAIQVVLTGLIAAASTLGAGSITAWSYALSVVQLPLAMVAGSIGTALLPVAARVLHTEGRVGLGRVSRTTLGAALWMLTPVALLGALFAANPAQLALGIDPASAVGTLLAAGLSLLLLSLPIQGITSVATRLCYGSGDTAGPVLCSLIGAATMALSVTPLIGTFGFAGLAVAVLIGELLESLLLLLRLRAHLDGRLFRDLANPIGAVVLASLAALAIAVSFATVLGTLLTRETLLLRALSDSLAASIGLLAYLGISRRFGLTAATAPLDALRHATSALRARVGARS
ncbi:MAG: murein biosynthesis integral membrane protein MurJ [Candidatus Limnocylindrus sp.]